VLERVLHHGLITTSVRALREPEGKPVVVKVLDARFAERADVVRRLSRLHAALAKVTHPHIAPTLELGEDGQGRPFLCRAFVEGTSLREATEDPALTPRRACAWLCDVLSALAEAHRKGLIHGALKPENIIITPRSAGDERAHVCDFGMARLIKPAPQSALSPEGVAWGAPAYMAPEQAAGDSIDSRADVYAVGAILYELLTRTPPFERPDVAGVLAAHQHDLPVPPRQRAPERFIPAELETVCMKALAKNPDERYASPLAMAQALRAAVDLMRTAADLQMARSTGFERIEAAHERLTLPSEPLRSKTKIWVGTWLLLLTAATLLLWPNDLTHEAPPVERPPPARRVPEPGQAALLEGERLLAEGQHAQAAEHLATARAAMGDKPRVLRALGEALLRGGRHEEATTLLRRYLELSPQAPDRAAVEAMLTAP
jgi:serine/threonine-protein kinase